MNSIDIFLGRMAVLVFIDKRPFSFKDFLSFTYEGVEYKFDHGTIRNIFSKLKKEGQIELDYKSSIAFYTLPGNKFGKLMTVNHTEGTNHLSPKQNKFFQYLDKIPMDKPAIHDIRLSFTFKPLWSILSSMPTHHLIKNVDTQNNKDITLHDIVQGDHAIKTTVHKTDTVSIIVACTLSPIPLDLNGIAKLTSSLARVEERLQLLVDGYVKANSQGDENKQQQYASLNLNSKIPNHMSWTVKMWHFGQDSLTGYSGEKFEMSWEEGLNVLHHVYSKDFGKNKTKVRQEIQEYPNKPLEDALMDKLESDQVIVGY